LCQVKDAGRIHPSSQKSELNRSGRSTDKNGKGTGNLAPVCKIKFNKKNEFEIENYGQKPFRLANVYLQK
jgi:hypothetical protein